MELEFSGPVFHWRGPAPYHFVRVPEDDAVLIEELAPQVSYGWGMIPVSVEIGDTEFTTALWPKDGSYLLPLKDKVRRAESVDVDDVVSVRLTIAV